MTNLGFQMEGFAWPLPAINDGFNTSVVKAQIGGRDLPVGLGPRDLDFLMSSSPLFSYPYALYSAAYGINEAGKSTAISLRDRSATILVGDSGGYSFISGAASVNNISSMRVDVLKWQEQHCDVGAILDVPTSCLKDPVRSGVARFADCLRLTQDSIAFAKAARRSSSLKLMNVIQGADAREARNWYDGVKGAGLDGFAFAGNTRKDLRIVCELLVCMIRDGEIPPRAWFHVFGTNHPGVAILLTAVQRCLRQCVNDAIRISFDSTTSFRFTQQHGQIVTGLVSGSKSIGLSKYKVADRGYLIDGTLPFPFSSPLADRCKVGDFLVQAQAGGNRSRKTDALGALMLSHHSVYAELTAIIQANRLFDMEHGDDWKCKTDLGIPWVLHVAVDEISEIFNRVSSGDFEGAIQRARRAKELSVFGEAWDDER